jgi:hypothetical protein
MNFDDFDTQIQIEEVEPFFPTEADYMGYDIGEDLWKEGAD